MMLNGTAGGGGLKWLRENLGWLVIVASIAATAYGSYLKLGAIEASMEQVKNATEFNRQKTAEATARIDTLATVVTGALGVQQRLQEQNDKIDKQDDRIRALEIHR